MDLERRRLVVRNPGRYQTTKRRTREVPIIRELYDMLHEAWMAGDVADTVLTGFSTNIWRDFRVIARRAGVEPYAKPCHTLRKNRETDWMGQFPIHIVTDWLGNSPEVAMRHYVRAENGDFARASGLDRGRRRARIRTAGPGGR